MKNLAIAAVLFAALVVTRWPLAPPYLFYIDNINFALSVHEFNIVFHQPHPPGYPLYVALLKALDLFIPSDKYVQLVSGALGSLATLLLIRKLGGELFGPAAGWLSVAILILQPSFWLAGIGDHVRTFLAAGGVAVALCVWRAWETAEPARILGARLRAPWPCLAAAALGVAAGFRPDLLVVLFPLLATVLFPTVFSATSGRGVKPAVSVPAILPLGILALTCAPWIAVIVWKSGGPSGFAHLFLRQWTDTSAHTSVLGGATVVENLRSSARAIYWSGVGALAWIWAIPFVWKKLWSEQRGKEAQAQLALLAWWWIPPFLFHAIVFVHYPDSLLDGSPALAVLGAHVLSRMPRPWLAGVLAIAIQAAIFFASPLHGGIDASYAWVKRVGTETADVFDRIRPLPANGLLVVFNRSLVGGRQIQYYFPHVRVLNVRADLRQGCPDSGSTLILPRASYLLWLPPADGSVPMDSRIRSVGPGSQFMAGACQVVVGTADR